MTKSNGLYDKNKRRIWRDLPILIRAYQTRDIMWRDVLVLTEYLTKLRLWWFRVPPNELFRQMRVRPRNRIGRRIYEALRVRQRKDIARHAPMCPANRWSGMELAAQPCRCRGWEYAGNRSAMLTEQSPARIMKGPVA